jgi:hypothetical protein
LAGCEYRNGGRRRTGAIASGLAVEQHPTVADDDVALVVRKRDRVGDASPAGAVEQRVVRVRVDDVVKRVEIGVLSVERSRDGVDDLRGRRDAPDDGVDVAAVRPEKREERALRRDQRLQFERRVAPVDSARPTGNSPAPIEISVKTLILEVWGGRAKGALPNVLVRPGRFATPGRQFKPQEGPTQG